MERRSRVGWLVVAALAALLGPARTARASDMAGAFSIVLRDPATGEFGVVAISHAPAVGAWATWVDANVGAVAVQGDIEPSWGPRALAMLAHGMGAQAVVDSLRKSDPGYYRRQVGLLDRHGLPGGFTGPYLVNWSGGWIDTNLAVQGNTMPGPDALKAVVDTLYHSKGREIVSRLFGGLVRARQAHVDFRGPRSAVLVVGRPNPDRPGDATRYVSLRVDDDPDPLVALARLYVNWRAGRLVAARLDDAVHAQARGDAALAARASAEALALAGAALKDSSVSAASLNAMAWALAQHGAGLDEAWQAIDRARLAEPRSNELADTAAEVRLRQGRAQEAFAIEKAALVRVPLDEYLKERVGTLCKQAGYPPDSASVSVTPPPGPRRPGAHDAYGKPLAPPTPGKGEGR